MRISVVAPGCVAVSNLPAAPSTREAVDAVSLPREPGIFFAVFTRFRSCSADRIPATLVSSA